MQNRKFDLLSLGEILLRLSPPDNERIVRGNLLEKQIGGAEANVAAGVSLMGLKTGVISKLPDNGLGLFAGNELRFLGVDDEYLVYDTEKDSRLGIYFYEKGAAPRKSGVIYDRRNSSIAGICLEDFDENMYKSTACFHTSGITMALGKQCRETAIEMMKRFKENGTLISFDVNFRLNLWSGEEAKKCIESILPYVDIFFCSEDTARLTFGKEGTVYDIMKAFAREYPISAIASTQRTVHSPKMHSFTSVIYDAKEDRFYEEKAYKNIEVVDRIGSGDAYVAGVLYGLLCPNGNCEKALKYGNACSAVKNTIPGDLPSLNRKEIEGIIADHETVGYHSEMNR
ncbi:MAG: sugar kinase [Lachnospiraceae bacterium]|nr:sugar kinase [Lachnospiraceae bacterium]